MNKALFKADVEFNWIPFVSVFLMIMIYVATAIAMFNPDDAASIAAVFSMMPETMVKAFGFDGIGTDLTAYLASYFYGFILLVFPLIYTIIVGNALIANHVDKGSMAYLLSTPNTRARIARTQALYFVASIAALRALIVGVMLVLSAVIWPGHLNIGGFLSLNMATLLLLIAVGSVSFLFSCMFSDTKKSLAFGAGIPVLLVMLKIISEIDEKVRFLQYLTPYALLDTGRILNDASYSVFISAILLVFSAVILTVSVAIFNRKNLNI